jgi:CRISPR/Cas system CSM-associated protein Csm2 small subunit
MKNLEAAFELFDAYNKQDPRLLVWDNISYPQEYFFAIKLYEWVLKLDAAASEELLLASRSQHIGRWEIPRESYPDGREPYLEWRKNLALHHAGIASKLMKELNYANEQVERVRQIILKKRIKADPDVQTMENALCLVFLQYQYEEFWKKHEQEPEKLVNILKRSLLKMDSHGHSFALELPYSDEGLQFIKEALNQI